MADNDTTTMHSTVSAVQNSDYDVLIRGISVNTDSKGAVSEKFTTLITPLLFFCIR